MTEICGATPKEARLIKKTEKACFKHLGQKNIFVTEIDIVDAESIRELNRTQRGVDSVTDVLSFPCFEKLTVPASKADFADGDLLGRRVMLGCIVICRSRAEEQAKEYGHSFERELGFLTCHGFLHLLGFDHIDPDDEKIMLSHQREIMRIMGLER